MTIDYVVLCHDEPEVFALIDFIKQHKDTADRILVLLDPSTPAYLGKLKQKQINKLVQHKLEHDYSQHRNVIIPHLHSDYCFCFDADELPAELLIKNVKTIIENYRYPDVIGIFRKNVFTGTTAYDCLNYGWDLTDGNAVNWIKGDPQYRLFKVGKGLRWTRPLHESLDIVNKGYRVMLTPKEYNLAIIHNKTIERQRASNERYNKEFSVELNQAGGSANKADTI